MRWSGFEMKLFGKMLVAFGVVILVFTTLSIFNLFQAKQLNNNSETMYTNGIIPSTYLIKMAKYSENTRVQMVTSLAFEDTKTLDGTANNLEEMKMWIQKFEATEMDAEEK